MLQQETLLSYEDTGFVIIIIIHKNNQIKQPVGFGQKRTMGTFSFTELKTHQKDTMIKSVVLTLKAKAEKWNTT